MSVAGHVALARVTRGGATDSVHYGSVAVEIAMKMAVQFWLNRGERGKTRFVSFRGGYL